MFGTVAPPLAALLYVAAWAYVLHRIGMRLDAEEARAEAGAPA